MNEHQPLPGSQALVPKSSAACRFCETVRLLGGVTLFAAAAAYIVPDQMGLLGRTL